MSDQIDVRIIGFEEQYARAFADLNYEWIEKAYKVEQHDREILDHPVEEIIDKGGQIFFAIVGDEAVGTVALIRIDGESLELAKMAVDPAFRGRGISNMLMAECIDHSRQAGAKSIILESNTKQVAAIRLYRKFGFEETPLDPNSLFSRANIRMELAIRSGKS
jgi:ribosomal protein S18 acetylase RimI-like enzyme